MNATRDDRELAAIAEKAAWWFVTNRAGPGSAAEHEAFSAWLRESPAHVREYLAIATLARDFAGVVQQSTVDVSSPADPAQALSPDNVVDLELSTTRSSPDVDPRANGQRTRWHVPRVAVGALAASIVAAVVLIASSGGIPWTGRTYETGHGQQQIVQLVDGSVLRLNSDSKATVRFSSSERRVDLKAGQALFDVAHDPTRRFRVVAGGVSVVAIGTRFDVYRRRNATVVTVVEGKVAVAPAAPSLPVVSRPDGGPVKGIPVAAGEQLQVSRNAALPDLLKDGGALPPVVTINVDAAVAWLRQQVVFEQKALAEVAEEFNRYVEVPIRIEDPALRHMRVTGILSTYDTEAFIGFLRRLDGVNVVETPSAIHVTRKVPAGPVPGGAVGPATGAG